MSTRKSIPPKEDNIEYELNEILNRFEDYCDCEEYHIHNSDDPLVEDTHSYAEWDAHKDYDLGKARGGLLALIESEKKKAWSDGYHKGAGNVSTMES